jgi:hypothetical protein
MLLSSVNFEMLVTEPSLWMYVVVRVNDDSLLSLVPVLQRFWASWPRARALPPCFVSTTVHACWRHRALPLQLPRYLHKLTSQNNHRTPTPSLGAIFYSTFHEVCHLHHNSFAGCSVIPCQSRDFQVWQPVSCCRPPFYLAFDSHCDLPHFADVWATVTISISQRRTETTTLPLWTETGAKWNCNTSPVTRIIVTITGVLISP